MAVAHLEKMGYKILHENYRSKLGELDIIARQENVLVVVEVKRRRTARHGFPCEAVTYRKQQQIIRLTQQYLQLHALFHLQVRFDVIEILGEKLRHIPNAFQVR